MSRNGGFLAWKLPRSGNQTPLPPNAVALPRRLRHYATWADLIAPYEPGPIEPGKVLAFAPPPRAPVP